jgi:endonuclease/exonuclease/phosphatase family metal-dependent hydrolase
LSTSLKFIVLSLCSFWLAIAACTSIKEDVEKVEPLRAMTFNIKNDYDKTGENNWNSRKDALTRMLIEQEIDFLGVQEALLNQVSFIDESLPNHTYVGNARDDGKQAGEYCALYYDSTRYDCIYDQTFWLSPNPTDIAAAWDAALPRIATMGIFVDKDSKQKIVVYNTHFDHVGTEARLESAKLLAQRQSEYQDDALILMGDLNAEPSDDPIKLLTSSLFDTAKLYKGEESGPLGTFNAFDTSKTANRRIDYIFTRKLNTSVYMHLDERTSEGTHISDHHAVLVELELETAN